MVSAIFTQLTSIIASFGTMLTSLFTNTISLFWDSEGGATPVGTLVLIGLGTGLVMWAFHYIRSLIRVKTK